MSVDLVKEQIRKFLSTDNPEVLAIKGCWGVGKTYSWEENIRALKDECKLKSYSYVSLFGINSIAELKQMTFLNAIDTKSIGDTPNIKSYSKKLASLIGDTKIPFIGKYVGGTSSIISSVSQLAMNKTIICFDDLERHSKGITIKDFMGLVSFFKEQKDCKIVLLLNEDAGDETFEDYKKYKEKIVDRQLHFEPTAEQCFDIMITDDFELKGFIRDCCIGLDIKNKRVIKKIVEHTKEFLALVTTFDESIKKQVIHSTIVLSWCYYCHGADENRIPEFAFVNRLGSREKNDELGWNEETTERWNLTLNQYGYRYTDEIDAAVARGIEQGFLDAEKLLPLCTQKQQEVEIQRTSKNWNHAWNLFHDSFSNNEDEIALAFEAGMKDIAPNASAAQYSQGVKLLREIGYAKIADELTELFIESNKENPEALDVDNSPFEVKDSHFSERLRESYLELKPEPTVEEILELRRGTQSYNVPEAEILARLTVDEMYNLFMGFKGKDLKDYIRVFLLIANSNEDLAEKVQQALDRISSTSNLNKARMGKFRV
ncbi:hypothetical protein MSP8886_00618 [Marinomonas spartinae]|uniref:KAP family P-loop domain protein n=1 Tax=Marinomonas spartinae TaxID=1792290 RepID=A0A1A8T5I2_9GAMM|nr:hypothetical protein [Marinomonas spartinae]SBS26487.1 hypothetical protein MSP8886_00618 [Marinomonas spartinae]